ncbi:hypothetical protein [Microvirgula aerodenitrificans]|uniref:hypothetical protein n=1 Tax=Microvirgula aerodenitrificans TaxID=57480 RepID=UPI0012EBD6E9|nr:hypothetical protein [Microvirgula aerodenitrificans]
MNTLYLILVYVGKFNFAATALLILISFFVKNNIREKLSGLAIACAIVSLISSHIVSLFAINESLGLLAAIIAFFMPIISLFAAIIVVVLSDGNMLHTHSGVFWVLLSVWSLSRFGLNNP